MINELLPLLVCQENPRWERCRGNSGGDGRRCG